MRALEFLADEIATLEQQGLLRRTCARPPAEMLQACSNDYLGYGSEDGPLLGAGGSRLVVGDSPEHDVLETACASWVGKESALVYSSGYAANVGLVSALAGEGDIVVSLEPNHASIIDGCRLSKARTVVVGLRDMEGVHKALEQPARRRFVVCESYYSMDGTSPDLQGLRKVCDESGAALIIDEAHALGVFGREGRGLCDERGVEADVVVGTFGKALAGQGAFVGGPRLLRDWLWNRSRAFVYSTGMSPELCARIWERVRRVRQDDGGRGRLAALAAGFRLDLARCGVPVLPESFGPIVPVVAGDSHRALAWERALHDHGVYAKAIRPPTVPHGSARLRLTVTAKHRAGELTRIAEVIASCQ